MSFTAYRPHWDVYDLTDPATEVQHSVKQAISGFFPHLSPNSYDARVRWHASEESCDDAASLGPLSWLLNSGPDDLKGSEVCLHDVGPGSGVHLSSQRYRIQLHGGTTSGAATGVSNDEHEGEDEDEDEEGGKNYDDKQNDDDVLTSDEEDDGLMHVELVYDLQGLPDYDQTKWRPQVIQIEDAKRSLDHFFDQMARHIEAKLSSDAKDCYKMLQTKEDKRFVLLRPVLQCDCPVKRRAFQLDDSGVPRVFAVEDLLCDEPKEGEDISEMERDPQLTVRLQLVDTPRREAKADPIVVIRCGATSKSLGGLAKFYWMGSKPQAKERNIEPPDVEKAHGYLWARNFQGKQRALLVAPVWTVRGLIVCNPDEGTLRSGNSHTLTKTEAEGPSTAPAFDKALQAGKVQLFTEGRLLYNFKAWNVTDSSVIPVYEFPTDGITMALRFVNHLEGNDAENLRFRSTVEIVLDEKDNYASICEVINEKLEEAGYHPNTTGLFEKPLQGKWTIELWILPQIPNPGELPGLGRGLYKCDTTDEIELHKFLNQTDVDNHDTSLFVEVHIVPRLEAGKTTRAGRAIESTSKTVSKR